MPPGVAEGGVRMSQSVKSVSGFFGMGVPVIQKEIVEHTRSCRRFAVELKRAAPFVVKVSHMAAVVVTVCFSVVGKLLHALHCRMIYNVPDTAVKLPDPSDAAFSSFPQILKKSLYSHNNQSPFISRLFYR